jgi:photosystem II stability/assembly factor-like uncharacterized protein
MGGAGGSATCAPGSWVRVGLAGVLILKVVPDPRDPRGIYVVGFSDIQRTEDGGGSWSQVPIPSGTAQAVDVAVDPGNSSVLYACTSMSSGEATGGIYKTTDRGMTWIPRYAGIPAGHRCSVLAFDASGPGRLFAGALGTAPDAGLYHTADGGASWTNRYPAMGFQAIAIDPDDPARFFAAGDVGVIRTSNGGIDWLPGTGISNAFAVALDRTSSQTVFAGTRDGAFRSLDGGATFTPTATLPAGGVTSLASSRSGAAYAGTHAGVFRTTDRGISWDALDAGLTNREVYALVVPPGDPCGLYAGTADGLFRLAP